MAHVEIKYGGADVLSDLGIAKLVLRGLPQRELHLEGEPAILVAQLGLRFGQSRSRQDPLDRLTSARALDIGEDQA